MNCTPPFQSSEKGVNRLAAPCAHAAEMERKEGVAFLLRHYFLLMLSSKAWNSPSPSGEKEIKHWKKPQALHTIPIGF